MQGVKEDQEGPISVQWSNEQYLNKFVKLQGKNKAKQEKVADIWQIETHYLNQHMKLAAQSEQQRTCAAQNAYYHEFTLILEGMPRKIYDMLCINTITTRAKGTDLTADFSFTLVSNPQQTSEMAREFEGKTY